MINFDDIEDHLVKLGIELSRIIPMGKYSAILTGSKSIPAYWLECHTIKEMKQVHNWIKTHRSLFNEFDVTAMGVKNAPFDYGIPHPPRYHVIIEDQSGQRHRCVEVEASSPDEALTILKKSKALNDLNRIFGVDGKPVAAYPVKTV